MNRIALMILKNIWKLPGLYGKLCHYAKHTDEYPELKKYRHIQHILKLAVKSGNVDLMLCHYAKHTDEYPELKKYRHIQHILKLAVKSGNVDLIATGTENIPQEGGFMLYGNHQGMFDVLAVAVTCDQPLGAVLKKELYDVPLIHQIALCTKSFAMDREDVRQSLTVIQNVIKEVNAGRNYLIFPEGTRSKLGNQMLEFHNGSFRCATKSKCPIVPVAFIDSFKVLDQKGSKPVTVQIHYLEPICYEEYKDLKTTELAALVKERIAEKIRECTQNV